MVGDQCGLDLSDEGGARLQPVSLLHVQLFDATRQSAEHPESVAITIVIWLTSDLVNLPKFSTSAFFPTRLCFAS